MLNKPALPVSNIPCLEAIKNDICRADCCRVVCVPFLKLFYDGLGQKRYCEPDELIDFGEIVYAYRSDLICVFLHQEKNSCNIYPLRPQVCSTYARKYNCFHYKASGEKLTRAERRAGDQDTKEGLSVRVNSMRKELARARKEGKSIQDMIKANPVIYAEMYSLATPEVGILLLREIAPWMVVEAEEIGES